MRGGIASWCPIARSCVKRAAEAVRVLALRDLHLSGELARGEMTRHQVDIRDAPDDEEPTLVARERGPAPTYEQAPATLEMRPSPFHPMASQVPTSPGIAPPMHHADVLSGPLVEPTIRTAPDVAVLPPVVVSSGLDMGGPTEPDGHPSLSASWAPAHAEPSDLPRPVVPAPGTPNVEVSQSLQLVAARRALEQPTKPARKRRPHHVSQAGPGPHAQTYQLLPALKREKKRESSDWPLIVGLVALALVIVALVGAVAYGVLRSVGAPAPAAAEPASVEPPAAAPGGAPTEPATTDEP
jgi:hypothetical protein